jgi:hypothetical protein
VGTAWNEEQHGKRFFAAVGVVPYLSGIEIPDMEATARVRESRRALARDVALKVLSGDISDPAETRRQVARLEELMRAEARALSN